MLSFFKKDKKQVLPKSETLESARTKISPQLQQSLYQFKNVFQKDLDFSVRKFHLMGNIPAVLLYMSSLVDKEKIDRDMVRPLQEKKSIFENLTLEQITEDVLYHVDAKVTEEIQPLMQSLLRGKAVLLVDRFNQALEMDAYHPEKRSITQPETERVVRGPRDGFIEQMMTNVALLRYRLPIPEFRVEQMEVGKRTRTRIGICYIDGVASSDLLAEVKKRLNDITIDRILDAGYIEQYIQDNPRSPFPQVQNTERPDKAVGNLLEGRVAILVDGSPFALIVPAVFNQFYQTSEDYNQRWLIASTIRSIRFVALIFSLTFSSFYVTILSFHPEMIPAKFVVAASSGRAGVPFPVVVEVLLMEGAMEILREATVRMPQQVGGALSIVGVLVIGQAAVMAGFVSPITVVIIAMSTIGSFATPSYNAATAFRLLRFPLIILSGTLGLLGLATGLIIIMNHMLSLRSFGVPYMVPVSPGNFQSMKDTFIRAPLRWLKNRPAPLHPEDVKRVDNKGGDSNE